MADGQPHANSRVVADAAARLGLVVEVVEYPAGTRTAADAARAIGCSVGQIVKSLVFSVATGGGVERSSAGADGDGGSVDEPTREPGGDELVLALVSGANQLDEAALGRAASGDGPARRVDADVVRGATGFPIGGVPPFGHRRALRTFVDADLLGHGEIWAAAGTPTSVFRLTPDDLVRATGAITADLRR